jgi:hypothetical protein
MFHPIISKSYSLAAYPAIFFSNPFLFQQKPLNNHSSPQKKVSFHDKVNVILIPERKEFIDAGLLEKVWVSKNVYADNTLEVQNEIKFFKSQASEDMSTKKAFNLIHGLEDVHPENLKTR